MTNQSTTDRVSQINPPKQTSQYLIYQANLFLNQNMHEKTVQMETDFSAAKTRNTNSDFLGPRNYKATAMHHGK